MATQAEIDQAKQEAADAKMREKAGKAYDKSLTTTEAAPVKKAKGGAVSASRRADGCATRGKTRGKMV
jgi:hypothetical protein